ncbi:MAG: UbiA family prenyltransferase, partial [Anaerolineales bacterium]|nr:UbiA family prenyltransferase [Anaerolineales bacterium]
MLIALIKTMRPRQWTKNVFIFAAIVFDKQLFIVDSFLRTIAGAALFCLISSCVYIFNDIADVESDRKHPEKKNRPIAAGKLSVNAAWMAGIALVIITLGLAFLLANAFCAVLVVYFVLNMAYSKWLKHIPIVDVFVLAAGFVLRVHAGVTLIH